MNIKMNISRIFITFFVSELSENLVKCTNWVDDLTRYIVEDSDTRQVSLITNITENVTTRSPLIDDICGKLLEGIPVLEINEPEVYDNATFPPPDTDTASTFYLIVYEAPDAPSISSLKTYISAVSETKTLHYRPKYMMLIIGGSWSDSFKELLEYGWGNKLLDFTIVEWVDSKGVQMSRSAGYQSNLPTIHRLNPFKNEYTKRKWTGSNIPLFPNKVSNLWGFPLRIRTVDSEPFTIGKFNEKGEPIKVGGANIILMQTIAQAMNATLKYIQPHFRVDRSNFSNEYDYIHFNTVIQRTDLNSYLVAASSESPYASLRTTTVIYDEFCAVVPIRKKVKGPNFIHLIKGYALSIVTVMIFWSMSRALRFSAHIWGAFYITRLFFGVSVTQQPSKNVERIVFATLLAISAMYSSTIYTALTDVSLATDEAVEFRSIEDLDESGLKPVIDPLNWKKTFLFAEGSLRNLMNKLTVTNDSVNMMECVNHAATDGNITCLMDTKRAAVAVGRNKHGGPDKIEISRACFWSDSFAFQLGGRLPYRYKIDEHMRSMASAGLIAKLYNKEIVDNSSGSSNDFIEEIAIEEEKNKTALHQHLLTVIIVGYSTSLFVFFIEIIVHRIFKHRKSKIQPVYYPYID